MRDPLDARRIAERHLDITANALFSGDFEAFSKCFTIPHTIETFDSKYVIETIEGMENRFNSVRAGLKSMAVTDLVRNVMEVDWVDDDTIRHSYQSRLLSGVTLVQAPYPNLSELKCINGEWKICSSQYAITDAAHLNGALRGDMNSTPTGEKDD